MILLLVGIVLTILMVFITRQLTNSLPPERFRSVMQLLLPAYLLLNLYFTLLMREPGEDYPIILTPLRSYFAVLGWDIQSFSAVGQLLQGAWEEPLLESTRWLDTVCCQKGIHTRFEYWGYDVDHDWPWWYKMVQTYLPWFLD